MSKAADMIRKQIYGLCPNIALREIARIKNVPIATVHDFKVQVLQEKRALEMAAASARNLFLS